MNNVKFEKFYLLDSRGANNKVILAFVHLDNGKVVQGGTYRTCKILQMGEIQVQTHFATSKFINRYSKHKYRNLRNLKVGSPINIYYLPVFLSEDKQRYVFGFYEELPVK